MRGPDWKFLPLSRNKDALPKLRIFRDTPGLMISPPQMPSDYLGIRLSICGTLVLLVVCFFLVYDGLSHRGTPIVPEMQQSSNRHSNYALRQTNVDGPGAPDMNSQEIKFANADVTPPVNARS